MVAHKVTVTEGRHGLRGRWMASCTCGWYGPRWAYTPGDAIAVGARHEGRTDPTRPITQLPLFVGETE